ncbi:hypothetical protein ZWY2020_044517 [Hordeum vulgare]|nr:hypothetical protein ZWY2020_044517 [Hordeum vulgare]
MVSGVAPPKASTIRPKMIDMTTCDMPLASAATVPTSISATSAASAFLNRPKLMNIVKATVDENPSSLTVAGLGANSADNFNARSCFFLSRCPHQRMTRTLGA